MKNIERKRIMFQKEYVFMRIGYSSWTSVWWTEHEWNETNSVENFVCFFEFFFLLFSFSFVQFLFGIEVIEKQSEWLHTTKLST